MNFRMKVHSNLVKKILERWSHVPCYSLRLILPGTGIQSVVPGHAPCYLIYSTLQNKLWQVLQYSMYLLGLVCSFCLSFCLSIYLSLKMHHYTCISTRYKCVWYSFWNTTSIYQCMDVPWPLQMSCLRRWCVSQYKLLVILAISLLPKRLRTPCVWKQNWVAVVCERDNSTLRHVLSLSDLEGWSHTFLLGHDDTSQVISHVGFCL